MTQQERVLAMIRADEQVALANFPEPEHGARHAATIIPLTRECYASIEKPPTRHRTFFIRTNWLAPDFVAESHVVFVKGRAWNSFQQVVEERPGVFGARLQGKRDNKALRERRATEAVRKKIESAAAALREERRRRPADVTYGGRPVVPGSVPDRKPKRVKQ